MHRPRRKMPESDYALSLPKKWLCYVTPCFCKQFISPSTLISGHRYKRIFCVPVAGLMRVMFRLWSLTRLVVKLHMILIVLASSCKEGWGCAGCWRRGSGACLVVVLRVWKISKQTIHVQPWGQDFRGRPAQGVPAGQSLMVTGVSLSTLLPGGQFSITYWISCWNNMISSCLLKLYQ